MKITVKYSQNDIPSKEVEQKVTEQSLNALKTLREGKGEGNDFLGWVDLPENPDKDLLLQIDSLVEKVKNNSKIFVVAGIGGSYLGAKMVIEALKHNFDYLLERKYPLVLYAGNTLDEDYVADLMQVLDKYDYSLAVISKSGTTTETAIGFRFLREHLLRKYGKQEAAKRILSITDKEKGILKQLSDKEGYTTFSIPDNVGGRYSVLTPVGLIPIAMAGYNIRELIRGAQNMRKRCLFDDSKDNIAIQYVTARNLLYKNGKSTEIFVNYKPNLTFFAEWWKQLYGESEGKDHKGIFPASVCNTTDLHSMGQYIQDGERLMFETVLNIENSEKQIKIPEVSNNDDKLDYLKNFSLNHINHTAMEGTSLAHLEGMVSQIEIETEKIDEFHLGELIYFFELCCGISGYVLQVNPFNQPGVENYKSKMFSLLGKK